MNPRNIVCILLLGISPGLLQAKKQPEPLVLTATGEKLLEEYAAALKDQQAKVAKIIPHVDPALEESFLQAHLDEGPKFQKQKEGSKKKPVQSRDTGIYTRSSRPRRRRSAGVEEARALDQWLAVGGVHAVRRRVAEPGLRHRMSSEQFHVRAGLFENWERLAGEEVGTRRGEHLKAACMKGDQLRRRQTVFAAVLGTVMQNRPIGADRGRDEQLAAVFRVTSLVPRPRGSSKFDGQEQQSCRLAVIQPDACKALITGLVTRRDRAIGAGGVEVVVELLDGLRRRA